MHRGFAVFVLAAAAWVASGCASGPQAAGETAPLAQQQKLTNVATFDLENCFPREVKLTPPANQQSLIGYLVSARPEITECLVDPKSRGPSPTSQIKVTATTSEGGVEFEATGENLTPEGAECIKRELRERGGIPPMPKGSQPVSGSIDFGHNANVNPAVRMGVNEASDALGTLRLQQPNWCECFEPWKDAAPASFAGKVTLVKGTPTPTEVTFDPVQDPAASQVQSCLAEKVKATEVPHQSEQVTFPFPIVLIHSGAQEMTSEERPDIAFQQLDALRAQSQGGVAIAVGNRNNAFASYDALRSKFKANPRSVTLKELREGCQALLKADDVQMKALQAHLQNEQRANAFAQKMAAQEEGWGEVVAATQGQIDATQKEIASAKAQRAEDEGICPKVTYKE